MLPSEEVHKAEENKMHDANRVVNLFMLLD